VKFIAFYIFYALNWLITLLPLRVLYIFSDLFYVVLYYIIGYRKKVVEENLKNSFPEKTNKELNSIKKKFYKHLCDLFIENLAMMHLNKKQITKRLKYKNIEILQRLYKEKKNVIGVFGHYNNWEYLCNFPLIVPFTTLPIYKQLNNKYFDGFYYKIRSKFGAIPMAMHQTLREISYWKEKGNPLLVACIADQSPMKHEIQYWTTFLNQPTPVYLGAEKIARKSPWAVVYINIRKIKRGYYEADVELITEDGTKTAPHEITEKHVKALEKTIRTNPEFWLWSHRRWKHKPEPVNQ
jgi:Kdo2-lipid IVA lauroyltransferase/acyltransferase